MQSINRVLVLRAVSLDASFVEIVLNASMIESVYAVDVHSC